MRNDVGAALVALGIILFGVLVALTLHALGLPWCTWRAQLWGIC